MTAAVTTPLDDYCRDSLPADIVEKLEAGAFRQLCQHLQERSDEVQNMDLMSLAGFCRNCLAKWMVLEARSLVDDPKHEMLLNEVTTKALNAMGYEEAAQHVYGMTYDDWKKRYQKKATDEQMAKYKESEPLHAKHNKQLLATRAEKSINAVPKEVSSTSSESEGHGAQQQQQQTAAGATAKTAKPSNVCCQDVEQMCDTAKPSSTTTTTKKTRALPPYHPAPLPKQAMTLSLAILTVSDRASKGEYETGDLSGPAVEHAVQEVVQGSSVQIQVAHRAIVPDEIGAIQTKLIGWCGNDDNDDGGKMDLIFTTGGTGMSPRDVTPEATFPVLTTPCDGWMQFVLQECSKVQPLATLSRGTAGVRGTTLIANLPGNPKAVGEIMPLLLPLMLHAKMHMSV